MSLRSRIRTARYNDPASPEDGYRLLVCRYRPRGVSKANEPWDAWWPELAPSRELHAARYGKTGEVLDWDSFRQRYLDEMSAQSWRIEGLARKVLEGETITLLCSSACNDPARCHRSLLKNLVFEAAQKLQG